MASSSDIGEKIRRKRRAFQESLGKTRNEGDTQGLTAGEEDPGETLKRQMRAQRQTRKKKVLDETSAQGFHRDHVEEISTTSRNDGSAEGRVDPVVRSRPPIGSQRASQRTPGSSQLERPPLTPSQSLSERALEAPGPSYLDSSMRQRMREKLKAARSKAESVLQQGPSTAEPARRLQSLRDRDTLTRFDREADQERPGRSDAPVATSTRVKFRETARRAEKGLPTAEESYNFFTFNFDPEPEEVTESSRGKKKKKKRNKEEVDDEHDENEGEVEEDEEDGSEDENVERDEEAPLVPEQQEDLFIIEQSSRDFLEVRKAEYVGYHHRLHRDGELLFTPSLLKVPSSRKLPDNVQPRYPEEEGLYVGERPPVSPSNENILENRILKQEEGKKWFGDDGRIVALPDPIKESSTRPPLFLLEEDLDPALHTVYRKALKSKYVAGAGDPVGDYQLDVDVSGLIFSHHPLFSREHVLVSRLAQLYDQYLTRRHNNLTGHLTDKLNGLRNALRNMLENQGGQTLTDVMQQRICEYNVEVRNTRQLRDNEQEKDRTLLKNIVRLWRELKALRDFQRFTNTPFKLYLRKEVVDRDADERRHEAEVLAEVMEQEAECEDLYQRRLGEYRKELEAWKAWRRKRKAKKKRKSTKKKGRHREDTEDDDDEDDAEREGCDGDAEEEGPSKPEAPERPDPEALEERVREKALRIRRKPGEPLLFPELTASGNITSNDLCPR